MSRYNRYTTSTGKERGYISKTCNKCGLLSMLCKCRRWWPGIDSNDCPKCGQDDCVCERPLYTELCEFCVIGKVHGMQMHNVLVTRMVRIRKQEKAGMKA